MQFPNFRTYVPHIKGFLRFLIRTPSRGMSGEKRDPNEEKDGDPDRARSRRSESSGCGESRSGTRTRTSFATHGGSIFDQGERHSPVGPQSPTVTPKILVYIDANRRVTLFAVDRMDVGESANATYPYYSYVFISDGNSRVMGMRRGPEEAGDRLDGKGGGRRRGRGNDRKPTAEVYLKAPKAQNHRNRVLKPYNHCNVIE